MKAKITKTIIKINATKEKGNTLYNFPSVKEAQKRLQSIKNLCKYPIIETNKNYFKANRYGDIYIFAIEKQ